MKIQFVFAPSKVVPRLGEMGEKICPPMGILYLAGYIREKIPGLEIEVIDGTLRGYNATIKAIERFNPDVLCVSYYTLMALGAYQLVNECKRKKPNLFIILGGPHATALPEEGLKKSNADVVVIGEGEQTLYELVNTFFAKKNIASMELDKIDGIAFRKNKGICFTSPRKFIGDINTIPFPARDLINLRDYTGFYFRKRKRETIMIMSRGCPYNCTFCSNLVWKTSTPWVRVRSPQNIADEIELLRDNYGIQEIFDNSDEFNNEAKNAIAICEEIERRKLGVVWKTQLRPHPLPEELVKKMAEAGCWYVHLGIESGNPETLKGIRKRVTLKQVRRACELLKKYNIKVFGLFMLFNVWEENGELKFENAEMTKNTLNFTQELIQDRLLDYFGWSITTPYPGSLLYNIALKFNLIKGELQENWDAWIKEDSFVMKLPGISKTERAKIKTAGSKLMAKCMLKSGNINMDNLSLIFRKGLKVLQNEIKAKFFK